jgi:aryl-alcohol dehydrogenase-like predicted oxidoreductase
MTLPTRALGRTGLEITEFGSGSWVIGGGNTDGQAPLVEGGYQGIAQLAMPKTAPGE